MIARYHRSDVTVVIVTYNSAQSIGQCLAALPGDVAVVVVDNASTDRTLALVTEARADARIIRNSVNEGYGFANNQGMAAVDTAYGLIVNPDAMVDVAALDALLAAAGRYPEAATLAPLLTKPNGGYELPLMGPWERNHAPAADAPDGDFCTWFLTGAALLWRMDAWRSVGGFDEAIFLYNEDADIALRTNAHKLAQILVANARVHHIGGGSVTASMRIRWLKDWHMTWSHFYFENKHGGDTAALKKRALAMAIKGVGRALLYVLLINPKRVVGNAAKASGAFAFYTGRGARP